MIKNLDKSSEAQYQQEEREPLVASSIANTIDPPPPFTQLLIDDLPPIGNHSADLEPPPDFSPYHADYFEVGSGDVVSHDSHLNTDGTAQCYMSSDL